MQPEKQTTDSSMLVRLKPYDPRRGHVIRRYTYRGIKFHEERGWYRVERAVAEHLRTVRQIPGDPHAQPAFDVCTAEEAKALDSKEQEAAAVRKQASEAVELSKVRDSHHPRGAGNRPHERDSHRNPKGRN